MIGGPGWWIVDSFRRWDERENYDLQVIVSAGALFLANSLVKLQLWKRNAQHETGWEASFFFVYSPRRKKTADGEGVISTWPQVSVISLDISPPRVYVIDLCWLFNLARVGGQFCFTIFHGILICNAGMHFKQLVVLSSMTFVEI